MAKNAPNCPTCAATVREAERRGHLFPHEPPTMDGTVAASCDVCGYSAMIEAPTEDGKPKKGK